MIVKIDQNRFTTLMNNATTFCHCIGSLMFTEIVKMGKTIAVCIVDEGRPEQYLEQK